MGEWRDVTNTFSEERWQYNNTCLELCEVMDDTLEISLFSSETDPYEIYVSFGIMYGITYVPENEAKDTYVQMKTELEKEYLANKEPTGDFINTFAARYCLQIENSLFDESALMESLFGL